jgi:L-amino acid N-acyltransferase YncA
MRLICGDPDHNPAGGTCRLPCDYRHLQRGGSDDNGDVRYRTAERADQEAWFNSHGGRYPLLVAEEEGTVVGWASISRWSGRKAYDGTGEASFYLKSEYRGRGIGKRLATALVDEARKMNFHTLIARVADESSVSLRLCKSVGFEEIGVMKEVGRKFGRLLDVHILQKMIEQN